MKKPRFCRGLRVAAISRNYPEWRGQDSNLRPRGYEPRELPGCSTPRRDRSDFTRFGNTEVSRIVPKWEVKLSQINSADCHPKQHQTNSTVLHLSFADVEWHQLVALFPVMVTGEFVTSQALLAVVLDAGCCSAAAFAVEDLGDAGAELLERDGRGPFFFPVVIPSPGTTWRLGRVFDGDASRATCGPRSRRGPLRSWRARGILRCGVRLGRRGRTRRAWFRGRRSSTGGKRWRHQLSPARLLVKGLGHSQRVDATACALAQNLLRIVNRQASWVQPRNTSARRSLRMARRP